MSDKKIVRPVTLAVGAALAGTFAVTGVANADSNASPFAMTTLSAGYMLGAAEGSCGSDNGDKQAEGSCGGDKGAEGSCGDDKGAEGSCGGDKEGSAEDGEGKPAEGKCGEGKCGEGKCGSA